MEGIDLSRAWRPTIKTEPIPLKIAMKKLAMALMMLLMAPTIAEMMLPTEGKR